MQKNILKHWCRAVFFRGGFKIDHKECCSILCIWRYHFPCRKDRVGFDTFYYFYHFSFHFPSSKSRAVVVAQKVANHA